MMLIKSSVFMPLFGLSAITQAVEADLAQKWRWHDLHYDRYESQIVEEA